MDSGDSALLTGLNEVAETGAFTVTIECSSGNEYDGRLGLRISSIFVILIGSLLGSTVPVLLARASKVRVPKSVFFVTKYFGSGVIIATAFIHLLAPAVEALGSPCLDENDPITQYAWPEGICLMTVFAMFLAELLVSHYAMSGGNTLEPDSKCHEPANNLMLDSSKKLDDGAGDGNLDSPLIPYHHLILMC
jgi:solute carrier family 39 (zinc transporter), member 1/2/3